MKKLVGILAICGVSIAAHAEKMGVVDMNQVMTQSKQAIQAKKQLEDKYGPQQKNLVALQNQIKEDITKLQRDDAVMTENQKKALQEKIINARKSLESKGRAFQQEASQAQAKAMESLIAKVKNVLDNIAKAGHYDLILERNAVQYYAPKYDVTKEVIKKLS